MISYAVAFVFGDLAVQQFSQLPSLSVLMVCSVITIIMARLRLFYGVFFSLGLIWASIFAYYQLSAQLPPALEGKPINVEGIISSLPEQNDQHASFELAITQADEKLPRKIKLAWYYPHQKIFVGETWRFCVTLKRPHATFNEGGQDYERWLFYEGIGALGSVCDKRQSPERISSSVYTFVDYWRQIIGDTLTKRYGDNINTVLLKALTVGDDSAISPELWDIFRITGTTHLIVISGSHIALVAGLIYWFTLKLWTYFNLLRYSPYRVAALVSLLFAILYASLAGFVVPTKRAVIMLGIVMIASVLQRQLSHAQSIAIALLLILVANPLALLSIGFWLSFMAVALILYRIVARLKAAPNWRNALDIQFTVSIGLSPLLLLYFAQISLIAPFVNFLAVPIVELILVPCALLLVPLVFVFPWLADQLYFTISYVLAYFIDGLTYASKLPFAMINYPPPSFLAFSLSLIGLLWLFSPRGIPARWLGLLLNLPLLFPILPSVNEGEAVVTLLDVGQGLAVVVQTKQHWLVYDTGAKFPSGADMGRNVVLPFLFYHDAGQLDTLVVSHGDNDHAGGAISILEKIPVTNFLTSVPNDFKTYNASGCEAGQKWNWDSVSFLMLSPGSSLETQSDNDHSCVLKIETKHGAVLLTGDIEKKAEQWLVQNNTDILKSQVLVAPHHGSKSSSTKLFLDAVQPELVLIPAGYRNQFKHPSQEVITRYQAIGARYFSSVTSGELSVYFNKQGIRVESLRQLAGKYWNFKE